MKTRLIATALLSVGIAAMAQGPVAKFWYDAGQSSSIQFKHEPYDYDSKAPLKPYVTLRMNDGKLKMNFANILSDYPYLAPGDFISFEQSNATVLGSVVKLNIRCSIISSSGVSAPPTPYVTGEWVLNDFPAGKYLVQMNFVSGNFLGSSQVIDIQEGGEYNMPAPGIFDYYPVMPPGGMGMERGGLVDERLEWVLYNPGEGQFGKPQFFRMRFHDYGDQYIDKNVATGNDNGSYTLKSLYLYTGRTPDYEKDPVIAVYAVPDHQGIVAPGNTDDVIRYPVDVEIPSEFWGLNTGMGKTVNPVSYFSRQGKEMFSASWLSKYETDIVKSSGLGGNAGQLFTTPSQMYWEDYCSPRGGQMRQMTLNRFEMPRQGDTGYTAVFTENPDGTGYEARWRQGVGPIGDDCASNLPYPVYDLPEGAVPTRLLYVRDLETNRVIYGDPALDPYYSSVDGLESDTRPLAEGGEGIITITDSEDVVIYDLSGVKIAEGHDCTISAAPGIYIAAKGAASLKIIVR